jgi:ribose/xylose/arabinose/galactoside ABC-type transport system permease subunit
MRRITLPSFPAASARLQIARVLPWSISGAALLALLVAALATPGFISLPSLIALTGTISIIGCIAVGMTFITLSGNIMSFSLGATCAVTAMVVSYVSTQGLVPALAAGIAFAMLVVGVQGLIIGCFRANPLIVSIAALSLILGATQFVAGGATIYADSAAIAVFKLRIFGIPVAAVVFLLAVAGGETILRCTRFGQNLIFIGSNLNAATVAGLRTWRTVTGCYLMAGLFTGLSGILVATRYGSGSMEFGGGYDYSAISAVLVGGTAIGGGQGSVLRTMLGVVVIAVLQSLLLLHGFETQYQYLLTGLIVLGAILLQARGRAR